MLALNAQGRHSILQLFLLLLVFMVTAILDMLCSQTFIHLCFGICTFLYAGGAVMGYKMFGEATLSPFTLNLPQELVATKIAVWTTVVNPFTTIGLSVPFFGLMMSLIGSLLTMLVPHWTTSPPFNIQGLAGETYLQHVSFFHWPMMECMQILQKYRQNYFCYLYN